MRRRPEIGIENGDIGGIRVSEASSQGARVVARPPRATKVRNIVALLAQLSNNSYGNCVRVVGAVVKKLDMQLRSRAIERGGGSQAIRVDCGFVKNRNLHKNMGKTG